jgi:antitoxin component of MazEF toxin-antitoxin module
VKLTIRRIGNSFGVIVPRAALDAWGLGEGDVLHLTDRGIVPPVSTARGHAALDDLKLRIAHAVVKEFTPRQIRAQILANLERWKRQGVWVTAYDEWHGLAVASDDGALFAAMLGRDDEAVRLRQSMPFIGLLRQDQVRRLHASEPA